jgi:hypothetical protein
MSDSFASLPRFSWPWRGARRSRRRGSADGARHHVARFERLEERRLLAIITIDVTVATDDLTTSGSYPLNQTPTISQPYSLREAIVVAHQQAPEDDVVINLLPAVYVITRDTVQGGVTSEETPADPFYGDFDVSRNLTINGNGSEIDANGLGRAFQITGGADVTINDIRIHGGVAPERFGFSQGGAIYVNDGSDVTLNNLTVFENIARGRTAQGGAIYLNNASEGFPPAVVEINGGRYLVNGALAVAGAEVGDASGGAFHVEQGVLVLNDAQVQQNVARAAAPTGSGADATGRAVGGAIAVGLGTLSLVDTVVDQNRAEGARGANSGSGTGGDGGVALGGAVYLGGGSSLNLDQSELTANVAIAGAGGNSSDGPGGAGGRAAGGALYFEQAGTIAGIGNHALLQANRATGGAGGAGEGQGGAGGVAQGGAFAVSTLNQGAAPNLVLTETVFEENASTGGAGGEAEDGNAGAGGAALGGSMFAGRGKIHLQDAPQIRNSATGGVGGNAEKGRAGRGGLASGGAVHAEGSAEITVVSQSSHTGPITDPTSVTVTGVVLENVATGGRGGHKLNASAGSNDAAGDGGDAHGGGFAVATAAPLSLTDVMFLNDAAIAGNGGDGDVFAAQGGFGTAGGHGGTAQGGALYAQTDVTLNRVGFSANQALGGILEADPANGAFAGGKAGVDGDLDGLNGGNGGSAMGGALFLGQGDLSAKNSMFAGNQAIASNGGAGGAGLNFNPSAMGRSGGAGGAGGNAFGGAIRVESSGDVDVEDSWFVTNMVIAGRGGSGGRGADGYDGGNAGDGGTGGTAAGGALSVHPVTTPSTPTDVFVLETTFAYNKTMGGDGGFAGNGGTGNRGLGGAQGRGGDGGDAVGGAIDLNAVNAEVRRSTIQENVISSGWGAAGGYGGSGAWIGGSLEFVDGRGGDGGDALGGGLAAQNGDFLIVLSTVVQNDAFSGFGGNGGFGGFGYLGGGNGGRGGNGGAALGGGIYHNGPQANLRMFNVTAAQNRLIVGGGGFAGNGGGFLNSDGLGGIDSDIPIKYSAPQAALIPILYGAQTVIGDQAAYLGREPLGLIAIPSLEGELPENSLGIVGLTASELDTIASFSWLGAMPVLGAAVGAGAVGAVAVLTVSTTGVGAVTFGTTAGIAGGTAAVSGFGVAAVSFGGISLAVSTLSIGAIVATKFVWAGIETGDWEGAAAYALGTPGDVTGRHLSVLLQGVLHNDDDDPPEPGGPGVAGQAGQPGEAAGTNVWGSARLGRDLIAEGIAVRRTRTRSVATDTANTYYVSESLATLSLADVAGGTYESTELNLIGAVDSGFTDDLHGTTAAPLDARLDSQTRFNGGTTPTLRLLPLSPGRNRQFGSAAYDSQNDYQWGFFYDLGAWGHGFNQALMAHDDEFVGQEGGGVRFTMDDLLANDVDLDGDPLVVVGEQVIGAPQNGTLIYVEDFDGEITAVYTPNPGFTGVDALTYAATDGEFTSVATITFTVLPALAGDFDVDGDADGADFLAWQRGLGTTTGATRSQGDANADGAVDGVDLDAWRQHFGQTLPAVAAIEPVLAAASAPAQTLGAHLSAVPSIKLRSGLEWFLPSIFSPSTNVESSESPDRLHGRATLVRPVVDEIFTLWSRAANAPGDDPSPRTCAIVDGLLADKIVGAERGQHRISEAWDASVEPSIKADKTRRS